MSFKISMRGPRITCSPAPVGAALAWASVLLLTAGLAGPARGAIDDEGVRRVLTLLSIVAEEYRESFDDAGALVRPLEYEEAQAFLAEASMRWQHLGSVEGDEGLREVSQQIAALASAVDGMHAVESVTAQVSALQQQVSRITGVSPADVYPPRVPSPERGAAIFREYCASCHGEHGDGRGPDAARLERKPADFTDPGFMRAETPYDFFHVITVGRRGAAMPAWEDVLTIQERWDVLSHLWTLTHAAPGQLPDGQGIYLSRCASCHGSSGAGDGPYAPALLTPVRSLADPAVLSTKSDADLFITVRQGIPGTAMPAFRDLSDEEIRKVVAFARALSLGGFPAGNGPGGDSRDDDPTAAAARERLARVVRRLGTHYAEAVRRGQSELVEVQILAAMMVENAALVAGSPAVEGSDLATALPARATELADKIQRGAAAAEVAALADLIGRELAIEDPAAADDEQGAAGTQALSATSRLLADVLPAYRIQDGKALYLVSDAYFAFEPVERRLAAAAPDLVQRIEGRFLELRGVLGKPGAHDRASRLIAAIDNDLESARAALAPHTNHYSLFVQSALIILREGFEVVLIVGALLTYVAKTGNAGMRRPLLLGAGVGMGLSVATALAFLQLLRGAVGVAAEVLEGATMLLASVVLFWVSYWLISKAEAERWQKFIRAKVQSALSTGSGFALGSAAFLAVYREGVETVLFYQALLGSARESAGSIAGGALAGTAALVVVYFVFMRIGMRLPIRQFFLGTSALLYYMAIVFAGKGVAELQEAGWMGISPVPFVPRIEAIGLYPSVETLSAQGIFLILLLYAAWTTLRPRRNTRPATEALVFEVRALREVALEIRQNLSRRPEGDATLSQLDAFIERAGRLEAQLPPPGNGGAKPAGS
jgi:high-affinity iron transporter